MTSKHEIRPKVEYVLFDLDGLMLDTERIYTEVTNDILAKYGVEMTWEIKAGLMGKPERESAIHLLSFFPDISLTVDEYLRQRTIVQEQRWPSVPLLPGVARLVQHLVSHAIPFAIATGSRRKAAELKMSGHPEVFKHFIDKSLIACADDGVVTRGKPNPDIYLYAARALLGRNVGPVDAAPSELSTKESEERLKGLVFEDAIPGMQAGKRAGMNVIWVPDAHLRELEYNGVERADQTVASIEEFIPEQWGLPPYGS